MRARYVVLTLLVLLSMITYMDRICISVAATRIKEELSISDAGWGWVIGAFTLSYGLFEIPTGVWGDRVGQRRVLARIVLWWSAFTALTGMARDYFLLVVTRFLFGVGEAGAYPNATGSIGRWFPLAERARAQGFVWGASRIGGALTPILVVPLMLVIGWRGTFLLFGCLGVIWAVVWWIWYRDYPAEHQMVTPGELNEIGAAHAATHAAIPWRPLLLSPRIWLLMLMYSCYVWGSTFYIFWQPEYLTKGRGFTEPEMAVVAALPFLAGAAGNIAVGFLSDRLTRAWGPRIGRQLLGAFCLAASAACLFGLSMIQSKVLAVVCLTLGFGIMDGILPCAWAMCVDIGQRYAGAVSGAMNSAGQAGSFACSILFGYLVAYSGGYNLPTLVIAAFVLASAVLFLLIDPATPLFSEAGQPAEEAR
jgi:ACS family glucarate transporter-like MFS transporter